MPLNKAVAVDPHRIQIFRKFSKRNSLRSVFEVAFTLLFLLTIGSRGFWPIPIGLADNGDYPKVLGRVNAWPAVGQENQLYDYLVTDYRVDSSHTWDAHIPTLEVPLAKLAALVGRSLLTPNRFDLRILGALHAFILISAFWLLLRTFRSLHWIASFALATVTMLVFIDAEYLEFLNSAFMDGSAITLLVLLFSLMLTVVKKLPQASKGYIASLGIVGALFLGTKLQHQLLLLPLLLFSSYYGARATNRQVTAIWFLSALLMTGTSLWMIIHRLPDYEADSRFSLVFLKLLPLSDSPKRALQELQRPASDIKFVGMHTWSVGSPMADSKYHDQFWRDASTSRIIKFYCRHLQTTGIILWRDLLKSGSDIPVSEIEVGLDPNTIRPYGVYRKSDDPRPHQRPHLFNLWSDLRRFLAKRMPFLTPALYAVCATFAIFKISSRSNLEMLQHWPLLLFLCIVGILSYVSGSLGDATDTARHIVVYQVTTDLIMLLLLYQAPRNYPFSKSAIIEG